MTATEVIIPWRPGCEHRLRALRWVLARWETTHPAWQVTIAEHDQGEWCKALAVMPEIEASSADVIVVADADVWCDHVDNAVSLVADGLPWTMPHGPVHRLGQEATEQLYGGAPLEGFGIEQLTEWPYWGVSGGGMVVLTRAAALQVPLDDRFAGWGGEDHAWGYALGSLLETNRRDPAAVLWHLWHPSAPRLTRKVGSRESEALRRRYHAAMVAGTMAELLAEVPRSWLAQRSR